MPGEKSHHINYLELLMAFLALNSFATNHCIVSILLQMDNITVISFINRMGGTHSATLSDLALEIWKWCLERGITVHAEHHPGSEKTQADWESRHVKDSSDWRLKREIFLRLEDQLGPFSIGLFASRTNAHLSVYCSWRPDPAALAVDALSIKWQGHLPYMFPPFALILRCLEKLRQEEVSVVLIAPVWPNQVWFPQLLLSLIDYSVLLPPAQDILTDPEGRSQPMIMEGHLPLAAWPVSGVPGSLKDFQMQLLPSSGNPGNFPQNKPT